MSYKEETFQHKVLSACSEGSGIGQYKEPRGVAIDETTKELFVADFSNHRVVICNSNTGEYQWELGTYGCIHGYGMLPHGIAITTDSIYITDCMANALHKYSRPSNQLVRKVGRKGSRDGEFDYPAGLTANPETGLFYVCDFNNKRIAVYDTEELNHLYLISHEELEAPTDIRY